MPAASYNELFGLGSHSPDANLEGWWPCMDNAANTVVADYASNARHGTLQGGKNTSTLSTMGPNSWLAGAFLLDGENDYIQVADYAGFDITGDLSVMCRVKPTGSSRAANEGLVAKYVGAGNQRSYSLFLNGTNYPGFATSSNGTFNSAYQGLFSGAIGSGTWASVAAVYDAATNYQFYTNGVSDGSHATVPASIHSGSAPLWIGCQFNTSGILSGAICDASIFSRDLTITEVNEWDDGPEPIVTSGSDSVSGTETVGETLSASGATWGLDSPFSAGTNGIITYTYQWTRSDDNSGTNEADISGATSSTYTLQPADVGKYIRRRTRATNDGGYDSAADHNSTFTGVIASSTQTIGVTITSNYNVASLSGYELSQIYDVRLATNRSSIVAWGVREIKSQQKGMMWHTIQTTSNNVDAPWAALTSCGRHSLNKWGVKQCSQNTFSDKWHTRTISINNAIVSWNTNISLSANTQTPWNTNSSSSNILDSIWDLRQQSSSAFDPSWHTCVTTSNEAAQLWNTLRATGRDTSPDWNTFSAVYRDLQEIWNVTLATGLISSVYPLVLEVCRRRNLNLSVKQVHALTEEIKRMYSATLRS